MGVGQCRMRIVDGHISDANAARSGVTHEPDGGSLASVFFLLGRQLVHKST